MIAIIDYKMGNLRSVENALHRLGATYQVTADEQTICQADHVLLPGVGNCAEAMHNLQESGLIPVIKATAPTRVGHLRRTAGDVSRLGRRCGCGSVDSMYEYIRCPCATFPFAARPESATHGVEYVG